MSTPYDAEWLEHDDEDRDPTVGLPADLARILRDPSIFVPQDQAVFELVASWMNAPSDTVPAMGVDEWRDAWSHLWRKYNDEVERLNELLDVERLGAEVARKALRLAGITACPRCDGQMFDKDSCGLCLNVGWLNDHGDIVMDEDA